MIWIIWHLTVLLVSLSSIATSDSEYEMKRLVPKTYGLSREMILIKDLEWELEPPVIKARIDGKLRRHIEKHLSGRVQLKLFNIRGKYGQRAVGLLPSGQKLRGYWRDGELNRTLFLPSKLLESTYDDAVRSRFHLIEFEIQLPPLQRRKGLPSVVYQFPVEYGSLNPKACVPRGNGKIFLYPLGQQHSACSEVGTCKIGISMRPSLVDPAWARGRPSFRRGRSPGLV